MKLSLNTQFSPYTLISSSHCHYGSGNGNGGGTFNSNNNLVLQRIAPDTLATSADILAKDQDAMDRFGFQVPSSL